MGGLTFHIVLLNVECDFFSFGIDPRLRLTFISGMASGLLMWTGKLGLDQSCVQRIVSLPSYGHAKRCLLMAGVGFLLIMSFTCFTGIIMFAYYYGCDPIQAGVRFLIRCLRLILI